MEDQRGIAQEDCSWMRKVETWAVDKVDGNEAKPVHGGSGQPEYQCHGGESLQHLDSWALPSPSLGDPNTRTLWGPSLEQAWWRELYLTFYTWNFLKWSNKLYNKHCCLSVRLSVCLSVCSQFQKPVHTTSSVSRVVPGSCAVHYIMLCVSTTKEN